MCDLDAWTQIWTGSHSEGPGWVPWVQVQFCESSSTGPGPEGMPACVTNKVPTWCCGHRNGAQTGFSHSTKTWFLWNHTMTFETFSCETSCVIEQEPCLQGENPILPWCKHIVLVLWSRSCAKTTSRHFVNSWWDVPSNKKQMNGQKIWNTKHLFETVVVLWCLLCSGKVLHVSLLNT